MLPKHSDWIGQSVLTCSRGVSVRIGKRIIAARERLGLSREECAAKVGVSYWALSKYETDERTPSPEILARLVDALKVSFDYLLGRTDLPDPAPAVVREATVLYRATEDLTPEQREKLMDYIEWLKHEHERKGIRTKRD